MESRDRGKLFEYRSRSCHPGECGDPASVDERKGPMTLGSRVRGNDCGISDLITSVNSVFKSFSEALT
jgi:hypothetical protein